MTLINLNRSSFVVQNIINTIFCYLIFIFTYKTIKAH